GFLALTGSVQFLYKCSASYDPADEHGILWNDPDLGIEWGSSNPLLSQKDSQFPRWQGSLPIFCHKSQGREIENSAHWQDRPGWGESFVCCCRASPRSARDEMITKAVWEQLLAAACAGVLCVILTAGLWPFTPHPKNEVAWLENGNGIYFGAHGTILSSGAFQPVDPAAGTACSLEMWAEAGPKNQAGTLLGFYSPEQPFSFSIYQYRNGLVFEHKPGDRPWHVGAPGSGVDDVFHPGGPSFVTITANSRGAEIYLDGALVERSPLLRLSSRDFTGQLAVGTSPV